MSRDEFTKYIETIGFNSNNNNNIYLYKNYKIIIFGHIGYHLGYYNKWFNDSAIPFDDLTLLIKLDRKYKLKMILC